ncbi:unnamed protein product [Zymoseptoria tritici ST99CH_1E4]|uniref:Uncharacterized protein n=1 Tax=Zymoseptoria tritici ST99CH_1E4 TaxID=1276532 RepID=A0A2H1H9V0_ZYMTR|nr:unnamed protein product [Zymoseptoria tritici ST99CH_1E4]
MALTKDDLAAAQQSLRDGADFTPSVAAVVASFRALAWKIHAPGTVRDGGIEFDEHVGHPPPKTTNIFNILVPVRTPKGDQYQWSLALIRRHWVCTRCAGSRGDSSGGSLHLVRDLE